jgi:hypothetical protein
MKKPSSIIAQRLRRKLYKTVYKALDAAESKRWLDQKAMLSIHDRNRAVLSRVDQWIDDDIWQNSVYQYGLPAQVRHLIDKDIGAAPTYTDAILSLASRLNPKISYLEIGVSVGKNFLQVTNHFRNAALTAFDIEEINPRLLSHYQFESRREFPTFSESIKKTPSSYSTFRDPAHDNAIGYLCGDVFDGGAWTQLAGRKFNLVFSDAFHSAAALKFEAKKLLEHKLLNDQAVVIVWDDLHNSMADAFREICKDFKHSRPACRSHSFIAPLKGWLGENWEDHPVGFFLSFEK